MATKTRSSVNKNSAASKDVELNKGIAALSYVWILVFVPLFLRRDSAFAQFHARQGLVLFVGWLVSFIFMWFPGVNMILFLVVLLLSVLGVMHALNGEMWEMPYLGKFAKKIHL